MASHENAEATARERCGADRKRKQEMQVTGLTNNRLMKLIRRADASTRHKLDDPVNERQARRESWVLKVTLVILEAFFRCSTLGRADSSCSGTEKPAEHIVKILAELQDRFMAGPADWLLYTEVRQTEHDWEELRDLGPKEQQGEVVSAGAYLLECFRMKMGAAGMEDIFLHLLGQAREKVLKQRRERKIQLRQQAVMRPRQSAERRRKRQKRKRAAKSAGVYRKKKRRMLGFC